MRTEDVLAAAGYGLWQWDGSTGTVTVDGRAARLLGLSGGAATHRSSAVRACLHAADYGTLAGAVSLATAEGTVAESLLRVVGEGGTVVRTVRARLRPQGVLLSGTLHEVGEVREVRGGQGRGGQPPADRLSRTREASGAFPPDAGGAPAEVIRAAPALSIPGLSPDDLAGPAVFGVEGDHLSPTGHHLPEIAGMAVAARYVPTGGGHVAGGDWYDVIDLPSGRTALVIGDVQGHDVRAAGIMGQLRIALRAYAAEGHSPDAVLARTSRFLAGLAADGRPDDIRFATCLYLEVDPADGTLELARAGHPEPAVRLGDGTTLVRRTAGGLPLGVEPDTGYPTTRLVLEPGEVLLLCTDGLIETGGHDLETGWRRLSGVLGAGPSDNLEALADAMVRAAHGPASHRTTGPLADRPFARRREDDMALLLLRRDPDGPTCAVPVRRTVIRVPQDDPGQIRSAREDIRALLHDWTSPEQRESAVLLVSELVTNVLVHTDDDASLIADVTGMPGTRRLHVEVGDHSDDMPHRRSPGELATSGRGLFLIEQLADTWGVAPRGPGKSIWFTLHEPRPA